MMVDDMEMDMTPMIDVSFQLLIFFLLTINFKLREGNLSSQLPKHNGTGQGPAEEQLYKLDIELTYDEAEDTTSLTINDNHIGSWSDGTPMTDKQAGIGRAGIGQKAYNLYLEMKQGINKIPPIKINTRSTVPTGRVITVIDIVKEFVIEKEKMTTGNEVPLQFKGAPRKAIKNAIQMH